MLGVSFLEYNIELSGFQEVRLILVICNLLKIKKKERGKKFLNFFA